MALKPQMYATLHLQSLPVKSKEIRTRADDLALDRPASLSTVCALVTCLASSLAPENLKLSLATGNPQLSTGKETPPMAACATSESSKEIGNIECWYILHKILPGDYSVTK
jgi:hypothetical protein